MGELILESVFNHLHMSQEPQITDESAFSSQGLGIQVVFFIITLGIYGAWWTYKTAKKLSRSHWV